MLTRSRDPDTSHEAAAAASLGRHNCRRLVLLAVRHYGPISAKGVERLLRWVSPEAVRGAVKWLANWHYIRQIGYVRLSTGRRARAWIEARDQGRGPRDQGRGRSDEQ